MTQHAAKPFDCIGLGMIALDHLLTVKHYPAPNSKHKVESHVQQGGGPVPTALSVLGILGKRTALISKVGRDMAGQTLIDELSTLQVDTSAMIIADISTPQSFIVIDSQTGERTVLLSRPAEAQVNAKELDVELIRQARCLHVDAHDVEATMRAVRVAKEQNVLVSVDIGSNRSLPPDFFEFVDIAIVSEDFANAQLEKNNSLKNAEKLVHWGATLAAVTCGANGSYVATATDAFFQPAFPVTPVDTTGAGDVFHGAALFAILEHYSVRQTAAFASAAAALACTRVGGKAGIPKFQDIQRFLQHHENV